MRRTWACARETVSWHSLCRGTHDTSISRMLFLHLPTRHPSTYPELEISALVQAAALLGVGLLFQGSCHRWGASGGLGEHACRLTTPHSKSAQLAGSFALVFASRRGIHTQVAALGQGDLVVLRAAGSLPPPPPTPPND